MFPLLLVVLAACESPADVNLEGLQRLPAYESIAFSQLRPANNPQYWELRFSWGASGPADRVIASGGTMTREQLDPATQSALQNLRVPTGFHPSCLPAFCFKYVVSVRNGVITTHRTTAELKDFLGDIDNLEEALVLLDAHGFYWTSGDDTGYRVAGSGWDFVALELVKFCAPVQTDRARISIRRDGSLSESAREVFAKLENACI